MKSTIQSTRVIKIPSNKVLKRVRKKGQESPGCVAKEAGNSKTEIRGKLCTCIVIRQVCEGRKERRTLWKGM